MSATFTPIPEVYEVCKQAARRVQRRHQFLDVNDLTQEAYRMVLSNPDLQEVATEDTLGLLQYEVEMDLRNLAQPMARRASRTLSYDDLLEAVGDTYLDAYVELPPLATDYTREMVETLLPAVWDESYCYGLPKRDDAPDPDMPRGSSNKARGNNLSAYIADIKVGWAKASLTRKERVALLLAFGMGWRHEDIAYNQHCHRTTITKRIETAIGKIVARLNGGLWWEIAEGIEA